MAGTAVEAAVGVGDAVGVSDLVGSGAHGPDGQTVTAGDDEGLGPVVGACEALGPDVAPGATHPAALRALPPITMAKSQAYE